MIRILIGSLLVGMGLLFLAVGPFADPPAGATRASLVIGSLVVGLPGLVLGLVLIRYGRRARRRSRVPETEDRLPAAIPTRPPVPRGQGHVAIELICAQEPPWNRAVVPVDGSADAVGNPAQAAAWR